MSEHVAAIKAALDEHRQAGWRCSCGADLTDAWSSWTGHLADVLAALIPEGSVIKEKRIGIRTTDGLEPVEPMRRYDTRTTPLVVIKRNVTYFESIVTDWMEVE